MKFLCTSILHKPLQSFESVSFQDLLTVTSFNTMNTVCVHVSVCALVCNWTYVRGMNSFSVGSGYQKTIHILHHTMLTSLKTCHCFMAFSPSLKLQLIPCHISLLFSLLRFFLHILNITLLFLNARKCPLNDLPASPLPLHMLCHQNVILTAKRWVCLQTTKYFCEVCSPMGFDETGYRLL